MANQRRVFRVAEQIRAVVASELLQASDPRFELVTITSIMLTPDLRLAKIYWVVSGDDARREEVAAAFESAHGFLRRAVGKVLGIRFVPDLKFYYDDTLDTTSQVDQLLARIRS